MFQWTKILLMRLGALLAVALCLSFTPARATETVLHSMTNGRFPGANPVGQLTAYNGLLYGATYSGLNGYGDVFSMTTSGAVKILHEFSGYNSTTPANSDGEYPSSVSGLVQTGGNFYGTTVYGGSSNDGIVYKMDPGGNVTILHSFTGYDSSLPGLSDGSEPYARLLVGKDGKLYGTTWQGGAFNQGAVFRLATDGSGYTVIHSFNSNTDTTYGPLTGLAQSAGGVLYGTTSISYGGYSGGIYRLNTDGSGYAFVHGFTSTDPLGYHFPSDLIVANDHNLYGTCTSGGVNGFGTVFKLVPGSTDTLSVLWNFDGVTGANPNQSLSQGSDHNLYGVTPLGGTHNLGTLFKLTLAGVCTPLADFSSADADGSANPPVQVGSSFYLTSFVGGLTAVANENNGHGYGAGMSISSSGKFSVIQNFYTLDAYSPYGSLAQVGTGSSAAFYGTTYEGGEFGDGAIFMITSSGSYNIIHHLNNALQEGSGPLGGLLLYSDGKTLYGTTTSGGKNGLGTIFKVTTSGTLTVLHHFQASDGYDPTGALVEGVGTDKTIYGTCYHDGAGGVGTVFSISASGSGFKVLHAFSGSADGSYPSCTPVPDGAGNLYGTCYEGGANNLGTLWKLSTHGTSFTKLFDFYYDSTRDIYPYGCYPLFAGKLALVNGALYGATWAGGTNDYGVIFQYSGGAISTLHAFTYADGDVPAGGIVYDSLTNSLYGACSAGGDSGGTVYGINLTVFSGGFTTVLHTFGGQNTSNPPLSDGADPWGGVIVGTDGLLYGTTLYGGIDNVGCIFQQTTTP